MNDIAQIITSLFKRGYNQVTIEEFANNPEYGYCVYLQAWQKGSTNILCGRGKSLNDAVKNIETEERIKISQHSYCNYNHYFNEQCIKYPSEAEKKKKEENKLILQVHKSEAVQPKSLFDQFK